MIIYEAAKNSDQTEGKGHHVGFAYFTSSEEAVKAVKGQGVMGVGDGSVYALRVDETADDWKKHINTERIAPQRRLFYGYRKDWKGAWGHGYTDNRDAPVDDPEYREYLRLKAKFEGKQ